MALGETFLPLRAFFLLSTIAPLLLTHLFVSDAILGVPRGKVNIVGGHSVGHSKQKNCMIMFPIPNGGYLGR